MSRRSPLVLTACAALVLAACGGDGDAPAATGPPAPAPASDTASDTAAVSATADPAAVAAPEALRFTAPLVGGGELDAASLAGQPVLFWFWAPF